MSSYQIKVGILSELTGEGEEWLVDQATRSTVIARFYNGNFMRAVKVIGTEDETITLEAA